MHKTGIIILFLLIALTGKSQSEQLVSLTSVQINQTGIEHLTVESFKEKVFDYQNNKEWKYEGDLPCIVDFYADWCKPCKMVAPILEELQKEYKGKLIVYKVNVDKQQELSSVFQTNSIPAFLFIPVEGDPQMAKGALPKETFEKVIKELLLVK